MTLDEFPPNKQVLKIWREKFFAPREVSNNEADALLIRPNRLVMWFFGGVLLKTVRAFVNRAHERNLINSRAYHELHAMIDRTLK